MNSGANIDVHPLIRANDKSMNAHWFN